MTVALWRIATETASYTADDLSGAGTRLSGGRWNTAGTSVVYTSATIALALLETVVHHRFFSLPFNRFLVRVDIPDTAWQRRETLVPPRGWDAIPEGLSSKRVGDAWAASRRSALLVVPSVVVPEEWNVLINPLHTDSAGITASTLRRWYYDPRLFRA